MDIHTNNTPLTGTHTPSSNESAQGSSPLSRLSGAEAQPQRALGVSTQTLQGWAKNLKWIGKVSLAAGLVDLTIGTQFYNRDLISDVLPTFIIGGGFLNVANALEGAAHRQVGVPQSDRRDLSPGEMV